MFYRETTSLVSTSTGRVVNFLLSACWRGVGDCEKSQPKRFEVDNSTKEQQYNNKQKFLFCWTIKLHHFQLPQSSGFLFEITNDLSSKESFYKKTRASGEVTLQISICGRRAIVLWKSTRKPHQGYTLSRKQPHHFPSFQ